MKVTRAEFAFQNALEVWGKETDYSRMEWTGRARIYVHLVWI